MSKIRWYESSSYGKKARVSSQNSLVTIIATRLNKILPAHQFHSKKPVVFGYPRITYPT